MRGILWSNICDWFVQGRCRSTLQIPNLGQGKIKSFAQGQPVAELGANGAFMSPRSFFLPALLLRFPLLFFSITLLFNLADCSFGFALQTASMICQSASAGSNAGEGQNWGDQALIRMRNPNNSALPPSHPQINATPPESHA